MHEASIAANLIHNVREIAGQNGLRRVSVVRILVGGMHHVVPEVLASQFRLQKKRHPLLARARLVIETQEVRLRCRACGRTEPLAELRFACPGCGSPEVEMATGMELHIVDVTGSR